MPVWTRPPYFLTVLLLVWAAPPAAAGADISHFGDEASVAEHWFAVNDSVMGGVSKGRVGLNADGHLEFVGELSMKNNGGFASIRTRNTDGILGDNNTITVRLRGDGRMYYLSLRDKNRQMASSHRRPIMTKDGEWIEVSVGLHEFEYTRFGNKQKRPELQPDEVIGIGFTLADKKPGPFKLEIDAITASKQNDQTKEPAENNNILGLARKAGNFKTLLAAIDAAGLTEAFEKEDVRVTVFAPTDEAFAALPEGTVDALLRPENKDALKLVLFKHVLLKEVRLERPVWTLADETISLKSQGPFTIGNATIIQADLEATNGTVHVIDRVLLPKSMQPSPRHDAMRLIETAIRHGVPAYNHGNPRKCADLYETAVKTLARDYRDTLGEYSARTLDVKLMIADNSHDHDANAWTLRAALDYAYEALEQ